MNKLFKIFFMLMISLTGCFTFSVSANARTYVDENGNEYTYEEEDDEEEVVLAPQKVKFRDAFVSDANEIILKIATNYNVDGSVPQIVEIYRSESENGEYALIGEMDYSLEEFKDAATVAGQTYFYKLRTRKVDENQVLYSDYSKVLKIVCIPSPGKINYVRATKAKTFTIKWNTVNNIDGYELYIKGFPNEYLYDLHDYSQYEINDFPIEDESKDYNYDDEYYDDEYYDDTSTMDELNKIGYKKIATITNPNTTSYKYKKAKHGYGYLVQIRTFKIINGEKRYASVNYTAHGVMDYYFCPNAENTKFNYKWPKTQKSAKKMMKTIKVKMWDFKNHAKHSGKKYTRYQYITVNKKYADTVVQIYKEIYKSKKKPPIYEAGSFRWRENEKTWSYHTVGTAIDMNCNENPMYSYNSKGKKKIVVGSFYKPKTNPYSIPRNGVIEKTFEKYGYIRSDGDLMHFTANYISGSTNY